MKATINGITYEGTLEEIKAIAEHMTPKMEQQPNLKPLDHSGGWWGIHAPRIYSGQTTTRTGTCPNEGNPCFCTGACQGKESATSVFMSNRTITI